MSTNRLKNETSDLRLRLRVISPSSAVKYDYSDITVPIVTPTHVPVCPDFEGLMLGCGCTLKKTPCANDIRREAIPRFPNFGGTSPFLGLVSYKGGIGRGQKEAKAARVPSF
jgi:hypothetical protein